MTVNLFTNQAYNSISMITALSNLNPFERDTDETIDPRPKWMSKPRSTDDRGVRSLSSSSSSSAALAVPLTNKSHVRQVTPSGSCRDNSACGTGCVGATSCPFSKQDTQSPPACNGAAPASPLPFHCHKELMLAERSIQMLVEGSHFFPQAAARHDWFRRSRPRNGALQGRDETNVTTLYEHELQVDKILGRGGFCEVRLVHVISSHDPLHRSNSNRTSNEYALKYLQPCSKSASAFARGAADLAIEARFLSLLRHDNIIALHYVSEGSLTEAYNCADEEDKGVECAERQFSNGNNGHFSHMLQKRDHGLRHYGYFLVLDYLRDTLLQRMQKIYIPSLISQGMPHPKVHHNKHKCHYGQHCSDRDTRDVVQEVQQPYHHEQQQHWWTKRIWQRNSNENESTRKMIFLKGSLKKRLIILRQIASALEYLHANGIIYRDVKPDNIGFYFKADAFRNVEEDCEGIPKLFDFGLVKELKPTFRKSLTIFPPSAENHATEENNMTFKLTGRTGSRRYMAPEVAFYKPYNLKADVYSFGILMYETTTLIQPFDGYSLHRHEEEALKNGKRPCLVGYTKSCSGGYWPTELKPLIQECWAQDMKSRPTMSDVVTRLDTCLVELGETNPDWGDNSLNSASCEEEIVSCSSPLQVCKGVVRGKRIGLLSNKKSNFRCTASVK